MCQINIHFPFCTKVHKKFETFHLFCIKIHHSIFSMATFRAKLRTIPDFFIEGFYLNLEPMIRADIRKLGVQVLPDDCVLRSFTNATPMK